MPGEFDVVIAGAGPVGLALAAGLAPLGLRVALVEPDRAACNSAPVDERALALAAGSQAILRGLGVWDALATYAAPIRQVHVSQPGRFGAVRLAAADVGLAALGYVVPLSALRQALTACVQRLDTVQRAARVTALAQHADAVTVTLNDRHEVLRARWLVAADGAESVLRGLAGVPVERYRYKTSAIVCSVRPERHPGDTAYERLLTAGPLALLPRHDGLCTVVLTVRNEELPTVQALDDAAYGAFLESRVGARLGRLTVAGPRSVHALMRIAAIQVAQGRVVMVGAAAQSVHPVAAQGFNLALRDVAALVQHIAEGAARVGTDDTQVLRDYAVQRHPDRHRVLRVTDGLARGFALDAPLLPTARALGMLLLDRLPPIKRAVLRRAVGLGMPFIAPGARHARDVTPRVDG